MVLSAADLLFLQCQKSELTPIPCSTFLSSVPKFSFVFCLIWDATCGWHIRVAGTLSSWVLFLIVELCLDLFGKVSPVLHFLSMYCRAGEHILEMIPAYIKFEMVFENLLGKESL